jgi:hypothetical protein
MKPIPNLGKHISIDSEVFADKMKREDNLRLMHGLVHAVTPATFFECSSLTLEGK